MMIAKPRNKGKPIGQKLHGATAIGCAAEGKERHSEAKSEGSERTRAAQWDTTLECHQGGTKPARRGSIPAPLFGTGMPASSEKTTPEREIVSSKNMALSASLWKTSPQCRGLRRCVSLVGVLTNIHEYLSPVKERKTVMTVRRFQHELHKHSISGLGLDLGLLLPLAHVPQ